MSSEFALFFSLLARLTGFFVLSPLFSQAAIPLWIRSALAFTCSLLLLPPLTAQINLTLDHPLLFATEMVKEGALGYLLGFLFSLLFEAAAFAGQLVGALTGFSATELLDPSSNARHPLLSRFFVFTLFALFLSLDLHHMLLRLLYESYTSTASLFTFTTIEATTRLFHHALAYALFPLTALLIVILCFAIVSRFFPSLQIFWTGFPIQLLIGFGALAIAIGFFGQVLQGAFYELWTLTKKMLFPL